MKKLLVAVLLGLFSVSSFAMHHEGGAEHTKTAKQGKHKAKAKAKAKSKAHKKHSKQKKASHARPAKQV